MSIINNALKKAQRQRAAGGMPPMPGSAGGSSIGGGGGGSGQNLVMIIAGAAVIIVVSVVATVYMLRESPTPPAAMETAVQVPAPTPIPVAVADPEPVVVMPDIKPAPVETTKVAASATPATDTLPIETPSALPTSPPVPEYLENPLIAPDDRIYAYIETLQVVGIRSSGADSKVLMNNRVYRVNDYVDRTLMLRLVKVSSDSLTFLDANGIIYTKYF